MARPNPPGRYEAEEHMAARIRHERIKRGMSHEGLAKRMTDLGCPIQGSAIYKIESATPRRRINANEAVAFADVFGIPVAEMLSDLSQEASTILGEFMHAWSEWIQMRQEFSDRLLLILGRLEELAEGSDQARRVIKDWLEGGVDFSIDEVPAFREIGFIEGEGERTVLTPLNARLWVLGMAVGAQEEQFEDETGGS